jgi:hypothetical protein
MPKWYVPLISACAATVDPKKSIGIAIIAFAPASLMPK